MKLHIGCWKRNFGRGWVNVDLVKYPHVHHCALAHELQAIPDDSCELVYASHVLEYYDWQGAEDVVLPEWKRVLKPGGTLRLAVPNFMAWAHAYMTNRVPLSGCIGPIYGKHEPVLGHIIYHRSAYDHSTLEGMLDRVGFKNIREWDWRNVDHGKYDDHSQSYIPHMDKEHGTLMSLNVEADK